VVRVDVQMDKLAQLKIPLNSVLGSIQSEDANIPGGSINAGTKTFNVKTSGKFSSIEDISNTIIYNANGKIVKLKDVATIGFKMKLKTYHPDKWSSLRIDKCSTKSGCQHQQYSETISACCSQL